jgi:hypothetical protein
MNWETEESEDIKALAGFATTIQELEPVGAPPKGHLGSKPGS